MKAMKTILGVAVVLVLMLAGCNAPSGIESADLELRSYTVPQGLEERMVQVLSALMVRGEERVGRAMTGPNGLVLVLAPGSVHAGIDRVLQQLDSTNVDLGAPQTIEITYWLVLGRPAERGDAAAGQDRRLQEIQPALDTIAGEQGATRFEVVERLKVSSVPGEQGAIGGRTVRITQRVSRTGGGLLGDVELEMYQGAGGLRARVALSPDRFVVLGESGIGSRDYKFMNDETVAETLYYVIRARVVEAG